MIIEEIAEPFLESVNEPKAYAQRVAKTGPKSRANVGVWESLSPWGVMRRYRMTDSIRRRLLWASPMESCKLNP